VQPLRSVKPVPARKSRLPLMKLAGTQQLDRGRPRLGIEVQVGDEQRRAGHWAFFWSPA
jgi:hypothetical protein